MTKHTLARLNHALICCNVWSVMVLLSLPWIHQDIGNPFNTLIPYPFVFGFAWLISSQKDKEELQAEVMAQWRAQGLID